jgi:hypothetical protein
MQISLDIGAKISREHVKEVEGHLFHDTTILVGVHKRCLCSSIVSIKNTSIKSVL